MATTLRHRRTDIVTLSEGERIVDTCVAGDIALVQENDGWWIHFIAEDGGIESYDEAYPTYQQALWAAKAAAEFTAAED